MEEIINNNQLTNKEKILKIKELNPKLGYRKIAKLLNITREGVRFHLSKNQQIGAHNRIRKSRKNNPLHHKTFTFLELRKRKKLFNKDKNTGKTFGNKFKTKDLINKIGENPKCYLTGRQINLNNPSEYHLDHIIPRSKGGNNSLENCGLACKRANQAKTDMTPEEFFLFCKEVLEYNGYIVTKKIVGPEVVATSPLNSLKDCCRSAVASTPYENLAHVPSIEEG